MNRDSIIDYAGYILLKGLGPLIRAVPRSLAYQAAQAFGVLVYYLDCRHRTLVYTNLKTAFSGSRTPEELKRLVKKWYRSFAQNFIEIFFIPVINKAYIRTYMTFNGLEYVREGFRKGKGVILTGVHAGSWELSNVICSHLDFPFVVFIRDQRLPRLNKLLNAYRTDKDTKIIGRDKQLRRLVEVLNRNYSLGMTADQGGKEGTLVKFFGKTASMASGAVRLAARFDAALIPVFSVRLNGPYRKVFFEPPFTLRNTGDKERDVAAHVQKLTAVFEKYITEYPHEYFWSYKVWKYSNTRSILVLSDGKTGHLRQSEALAAVVREYLGGKKIESDCKTVEVQFKRGRWRRLGLAISSMCAGKYSCQGCLWCLKSFLTQDSYKALTGTKPDIIISCGSSVTPVTRILARENSCASMAVMRPPFPGTDGFTLVVAPRHDGLTARKNTAVIEGALNLIDGQYTQSQARILDTQVRISREPVIGVLIGGDTKDFLLSAEVMAEAVKNIKKTVEALNGELLITTSRRTSPAIEDLLKREFADYPRCRLLVIANEKNFPWAVGGIVGRSTIVVTSPESISMVSEAASSKKYAVVFNAAGLGKRHRKFLANLSQKQYIYLPEARDLGEVIMDLWRRKPPVKVLDDRGAVREALKRVL